MCWGRGFRTVVLSDLELQLVHRTALEILGWMGNSSLCGSLHGLGEFLASSFPSVNLKKLRLPQWLGDKAGAWDTEACRKDCVLPPPRSDMGLQLGTQRPQLFRQRAEISVKS